MARDVIRINYGKLSKHSEYLGKMIAALEDTKTSLVRAGEKLSEARGAAAEALEGRRLATMSLIDGNISKISEVKEILDGYRLEMSGLAPPIVFDSDVRISKTDYVEMIATLKSAAERGFETAPIESTDEKYWISHFDGVNVTYEEDTYKYYIEEDNGITVEELRNTKRVAAHDRVLTKISEIENEYNQYIVPFFDTDEAWAQKLPTAVTFMTDAAFEAQIPAWTEYARLMPGGVPNWEYLQAIMQTQDPNSVSQVKLDAVLKMYNYFQGYLDREHYGADAHVRAWAEASLAKFFRMCYSNFIVDIHQGKPVIGVPGLSLLLYRIGLGEKFYNESGTPTILDFLAGGSYIARYITMDRLSKGLSMMGFKADTRQGIFYTDKYTWQNLMGYSYICDFFFAAGTFGQMDSNVISVPITRNINGVPVKVNMMIWSWKGNYLNLGAGAETGVYFGMWTPLTELIPGIHGGYNGAVTGENGSFKMTLTLIDKDENVIFRREPDGEECWITGFKPSYQNPIVDDLTSVTKIYFDTDVAGAQKEFDFAQETYDNAVSQYGKDSFEVNLAYKQLESAAINLDERNIEKQAFEELYQKYEVEKESERLGNDVTLEFDKDIQTMTITMGKAK